MKKFDLEAAKNGAAVITRDGRPARIICFDRNCKDYPLIALVKQQSGTEDVAYLSKNGLYTEANIIDELDLFMAPVKKKGWINIYPCLEDNSIVAATSHIFRTRQDADNQNGSKSRIACVEIEWEE